MHNIVTIRELRFAWQQRDWVLDIDHFQIDHNERCFLYGPSGCGKSTLLGAIAGVNRPAHGSVEVLGQNLYHLSHGQRDQFRAHHIGFIFQMFNLLPYLSIVENVTLPCHFSNVRKQKAIARSGSTDSEARRLLADLGLKGEALLRRKVSELSIGQQQRVASARALIGSPEVIIADEPTSALDTDSRESFIRTLFQECDDQGSTLLFVSHDMSLSRLFSRQMALTQLNRASVDTGLPV